MNTMWKDKRNESIPEILIDNDETERTLEQEI
jgi:hypothetical protein